MDVSNLRITIDELILDGATHLDKAQLVQALQQTLAQNLAVQGLSTAVNVPEVTKNLDGFSAETVAQSIVQTMYGGFK